MFLVDKQYRKDAGANGYDDERKMDILGTWDSMTPLSEEQRRRLPTRAVPTTFAETRQRLDRNVDGVGYRRNTQRCNEPLWMVEQGIMEFEKLSREQKESIMAIKRQEMDQMIERQEEYLKFLKTQNPEDLLIPEEVELDGEFQKCWERDLKQIEDEIEDGELDFGIADESMEDPRKNREEIIEEIANMTMELDEIPEILRFESQKSERSLELRETVLQRARFMAGIRRTSTPAAGIHAVMRRRISSEIFKIPSIIAVKTDESKNEENRKAPELARAYNLKKNAEKKVEKARPSTRKRTSLKTRTSSRLAAKTGKLRKRVVEETAKKATNEKKNKTKSRASLMRCHCEMEHQRTSCVECKKCKTWQHMICMGLKTRSNISGYLCEHCKPRRLILSKHEAIRLQKKYIDQLVKGRQRYWKNKEKKAKEEDAKKGTRVAMKIAMFSQRSAAHKAQKNMKDHRRIFY